MNCCSKTLDGTLTIVKKNGIPPDGTFNPDSVRLPNWRSSKGESNFVSENLVELVDNHTFAFECFLLNPIKTHSMAQLIVEIEDGYSVSLLRKAILMLKGVTTVKESKTSSDNTPNAVTLRAIEDAKAGRTIKAKSVADLLSQLND